MSEPSIAKRVDAKGFVCPMPLFQARKALRDVAVGEVLELLATDPTTKVDIPDWVQRDGHQLLLVEEANDAFRFLVRRGR